MTGSWIGEAAGADGGGLLGRGQGAHLRSQWSREGTGGQLGRGVPRSTRSYVDGREREAAAQRELRAAFSRQIDNGHRPDRRQDPSGRITLTTPLTGPPPIASPSHPNPPSHTPAMRPALRLLAAVKPVGRVLEPGAPTGLCGLLTHPAPRSTLVYLYSKTLDKLKQFPESSVYRQSTEALTRHRLNIIERIEPAGLKEWEERVQKQVEANPDAFEKHGVAVRRTADGRAFVVVRQKGEVDEREEEWDGEITSDPEPEGVRSSAERLGQKEAFGHGRPDNLEKAQDFDIEKEPSLTFEQYVLALKKHSGHTEADMD